MDTMTWCEVPDAERRQRILEWLEQGYTFRMGFADSDGAGVDLCYLFADPNGAFAVLRCRVAVDAEVESLVSVLPSVHWDEREIQDMFGVTFTGHPDPRPLLLPDTYEGPPPLLPVGSARKPQTWTARALSHHGMVQIPVGPVHAGIIESGHFLFSAMGETVLQMDVRLSWNHRGIEANIAGRSLFEATGIVERICGNCSASHQAAFAHAVETIHGMQIEPAMDRMRTVILEMERIYNHLNDLGQLATGVGLNVLAQQGLHLKERALRLQADAFGHRYLFGTIRPGGVRGPKEPGRLREQLGELARDAARWADRLFSNMGLRERLAGTGIVPRAAALSLGAVGPVARASGVASDVRSDRPYAAYREVTPKVVTRTAGDAMARAEVRRHELAEAFSLAQALLVGATATAADLSWGGMENLSGSGSAASIIESPRGANVYFLRLEHGKVARYHLRSSSFTNWPLIMIAARDNIIGDFPLVNKSFELCYACSDR